MATTSSAGRLSKDLGAQGTTSRIGAYLSRLRRAERAYLVIAAIGIELGFLVRFLHVTALGEGFPLNDGGMFYAMVEDLRAASYALPAETSYNGGDIPYVYPPFSFYVAAVLVDLGGWSLIDVFRLLPLIVSVLTIVAFYPLARTLPGDRLWAAVATLLFALAPRAFDWEIAGGGLTRSFGFLFAILAINQAYRLYERPTALKAAALAAFWALALLSHPEMGWFATFSCAVFFLAFGRSWRSLAFTALAAFGVAILMAPWLVTVIGEHGLGPFVSATQTGGRSVLSPLALLLFDFTSEPFFPLIAALGLLGIIASIGDRRYLLPAWLCLMFILDPRKAWTLSMVPLAMLAAVGFFQVLLPQMERALAHWRAASDTEPRFRMRVVSGTLLIIALYGVISAIGSLTEDATPLHALSPGERETMAWVRGHTAPESRFLVMSGSTQSPWTDARSEWFPALADRVSEATLQGSEWSGGREGLAKSYSRYFDLQACADGTASCLEDWGGRYGLAFTHIYLPKQDDRLTETGVDTKVTDRERDCCAALRNSLAGSADFRLVHDGIAAQIFERRPAARTLAGPTNGEESLSP